MFKSFRIPWRDFKYGILNLIDWFSIIWEDRNWDHVYFERILLKKLKNMVKYFDGSRLTENIDFEIYYLNICIKLLERVIDEYYEMEIHEYYHKDYRIDERGHLKSGLPDYDNLGAYFDKYPRVYKKVATDPGLSRRIDREGIAYLMSYEIQKKARRLLYKIIAEHSPRWWD